MAANADTVDAGVPGEEQELPEDLKDIKDKWESLTAASTERKEVLEEIVPMAKEYEQCQPVVCSWLQDSRAKMDDLDEISNDSDELQKQEESLKV